MAVDVVTEIVIDHPCAEVAAYAVDPSNAPEWYVKIKAVRWETPPPIALESRLAFEAQFAKVGAPMMSAAMRRANHKNLANLNQILERSDSAS